MKSGHRIITFKLRDQYDWQALCKKLPVALSQYALSLAGKIKEEDEGFTIPFNHESAKLELVIRFDTSSLNEGASGFIRPRIGFIDSLFAPEKQPHCIEIEQLVANALSDTNEAFDIQWTGV